MTQPGLHEDYARKQETKGGSDRALGLVFAVVFTIVGAWPLLDATAPRWWVLAVAMVFLVLALVRPALLAPLNRLWTQFGLLLSRLTQPVVLAMLFYTAVAPMGLLARLFGKDLLELKLDRDAESYWIARQPPGPEPETMSNQF